MTQTENELVKCNLDNNASSKMPVISRIDSSTQTEDCLNEDVPTYSSSILTLPFPQLNNNELGLNTELTFNLNQINSTTCHKPLAFKSSSKRKKK